MVSKCVDFEATPQADLNVWLSFDCGATGLSHRSPRHAIHNPRNAINDMLKPKTSSANYQTPYFTDILLCPRLYSSEK
jgi:hypothetical protein